MASAWFYCKDGNTKNKLGPITAAQLQALARSGELLPNDLVWRDDLARWFPAIKVKGLFPTPSPAIADVIPVDTSGEVKTDSGGSSVPAKAEPDASRRPRIGHSEITATHPASPAHPPSSESSTPSKAGAGRSTIQGPKAKRGKLPMTWLFIGIGASVLFGFCCCGGLFIYGIIAVENDRKELADADRLWDKGQKDDAVIKYRKIIDSMPSIAKENPKSFQRVIEYDVTHENLSPARAYIEKAENEKITLSFNEPKARELMAQVQREREEKAAAERKEKEQAEAARAKEKEQAEAARAKEKEQAEAARAKEKAAKENPPGDIIVTAGVLFAAYEENEVAADQKYKGKRLEIRGVVGTIGKNILNARYVAFNVGEFEIGSVQCMFSKRHDDELATLKPGNVIAIRGKCAGKSLVNVMVEDCQLAKLDSSEGWKK